MWYDFRDDRTNPGNNEHNFGIVKYNYTTKPAFAAAAQSSNILNGSIYIGRLDLSQNLRGFTYLKDGEPIFVVWNTSDTDEHITTAHSKAEDMYGNAVELGTGFAVDKNLKYLFGVSRNYIVKTAYDSAISFYNDYLEEYKDYDAQQDKVNAAIENLRTYSVSDADKALEDNINIGLALIENRNDILDVTLSSMMNYLRYAQEALAGAYSEKNKDAAVGDMSEIDTLRTNIDSQKYGDSNIQKQFTEKILGYAENIKPV